MQLVLTQPLCILFPQSLKALISGNTSHYISANSLILYVRLRWSAIRARNLRGFVLEKWRCIWGSLDFMRLRFKWKDVVEKNSKANWINSRQWQSSQPHMQPTMAALLCARLFIPATSEEDADIVIHRPSLAATCASCCKDSCSYLLPAQLVVHLYPLHFLQTLLQPLVALPQLTDVVTSFGQDATFALGRAEMSLTQLESWHLEREMSLQGWQRWGGKCNSAYRSSLGAVHTAVWDDLGEGDDPVVDLVSSPPLNWQNEMGTDERSTSWFVAFLDFREIRGNFGLKSCDFISWMLSCEWLELQPDFDS